VSRATVDFSGAGTCVVDANQAGNSNYSAAPEVRQTITVTDSVGSTSGAGPSAGKQLVFSDDFTGSSLNTSKWDTCYPWWPSGATSGCTNLGNNELEWYLPSQVQVSGGALHLVTSETPTPGTGSGGTPKTYPWRSGMVTTYNSFDFTYGYIQVTAQVPKGDGFWPALWLLPQTMAWPPEIDFAEGLGSDTFSNACTFHSTTSGQHQGIYQSPTDLSAGWHTYGLLWEPGSLTCYVDGHATYTYTRSDVPDQPMYFLADLAVSGSNPPDATTATTASFNIENIQIYQTP
jgi:beta-glucanase (GH16 family)